METETLDEEEVLIPQLEVDRLSEGFIEQLVERLILATEEFCDVKFYPYQLPIAQGIIRSIVLGDGEEITLIASRQSGKSEVLSNVIASLMVWLPNLAPVFPDWLEKFKGGFKVGIFAPVDDQAETVWSRVVSKLQSERAEEFFLDPDIEDKAVPGGGKGKTIILRNNKSLCRMQSCHPRAKIESKTYHFVLIDETQEADEEKITKSIKPMLAWNNGTLVMAGTAQRYKCYFLKSIQANKRRDVAGGRKHRQCHFEYDYKVASKYNDNYRRYVEKERIRLGEDSDEFRMSYLNEWILDKGMFVTMDRLEALYDNSMPIIKEWWKTPVVAGIDVARSNDSTVATVVWVDWDYPDPFGFYEHRVLAWLEINNLEWEQQYFKIIDFLRNYNVIKVGVDAQGVGGAVAERLGILMQGIDVVAVGSDAKAQNDRWTHLTQLIQRQQLVIPGHSYARRTRPWKRFNQQMLDLERIDRGPYMLAAAPDERNAYDDYPDSLALACAMTVDDSMPTISVINNPFY
jgi:Terminase RNaseH-like domain